MDLSTDTLDNEELLHLAVSASQADRHDQAISLLKQAAQRSPGDARVMHCLGAEHAQIGMYDRAIAEMSRALELDPGLVPARFQLGLLCLTTGQAGQAEEVLRPLADLGEGDSYRHFGAGLVSLLHDAPGACLTSLEQGLALGTGNPSLAADMARLAEAVTVQMGVSLPPAGPAADLADPEPASANLWMSRYQKNGGGAQ